MKNKLLNLHLVKELEDIAKAHAEELAICEKRIYTYHCPTCGQLPVIEEHHDPLTMSLLVRIGCDCREPLTLTFSEEEMVNDMHPYWLVPYFIKYDIVKKWNTVIQEEMKAHVD